MSHRRNLIKLIEKAAYRHDTWQVFSDFVEMAALSISNSVDLAQFDEREAQYMRVAQRYTKEELLLFPEMLGELAEELETGFDDVLGGVFMEMELGNKWRGQFFTPYHICKMMARMHVDDRMREIIDRQGFIRVNEPACGGAAMIVALAEEMKLAGINYQQHIHVVAQDVDLKAAHMAYIQLSLLHVPAIVIQGNTLAGEELSRWYTPAHILGLWNFKLRRADRAESSELPEDETERVPSPSPTQLSFNLEEAA